ncbi:MAG: hypothetical protein NUV77_25005 [Thermoguttaceae bacterium]|jgi:hypothetical protein|nr:hypothetical protein [Thermoguttaceae bacterium]
MAGPYRKPRADLYTVMLLVAWLALLVGIALLYFETAEYGSPPWSRSGSAPTSPAAAAVAWDWTTPVQA